MQGLKAGSMFPLERIGQGIAALFPGTEPSYSSTVPVRQEFAGRNAWVGLVDVFTLVGHVAASRCYAWEEHADVEDGKAKVHAVLAIPPVRSAADAVRWVILAREQGTRSASTRRNRPKPSRAARPSTTTETRGPGNSTRRHR